MEQKTPTTGKSGLSRRTLMLRGAGLSLAAPAALHTLASGTSAYAQAADEATLVAAAKREGRGVFYTTAPAEEAQRVTIPFKAKYGVDIDIVRLTSNELEQRFVAEFDTGNFIADVFYTSNLLFINQGFDKGWFAKLGDLPSAKGWPGIGWDGGSALVVRTPYSIAWNSSIIPQGLKSWEDMLNPQWKGRIGIGDPRVLANANLWYSLMRKTYGDEFLRKLGAQSTFLPSTVPGLQQVAAGALAIYAPASHNTVVDLQAKGAPLQEGFISPTVASDNRVCVATKAPHPNVARLFVDYYMSVEAQAQANKGGFSVLSNVPGTLPMPSVTEMDVAKVNAEKPQLVALLGLS